MDITRRINLLKFAAKKQELRGKKSRKDISKQLERAKASYMDAMKKMKSAESEIAKFTKIMESTGEALTEAKEQISLCHKLLQDMDFMGADHAKIGKDTNDVMFAVEGRWRTKSPESPDKKDENNSENSDLDYNDIEKLIQRAKHYLNYLGDESEAMEELCSSTGKSKELCRMAIKAAQMLLNDEDDVKSNKEEGDEGFAMDEGVSISRFNK